jgi:hypothetical protein
MLVVGIALFILLGLVELAALFVVDFEGDVTLPQPPDTLPDPWHAQGETLPTLKELQHGWDVSYEGLTAVTVEDVKNVTTEEMDTEVSHGTTKHPLESPIVRNCIDKHGTMDGTVWKFGDYFMRTCDLGPHDLSDDPNDRWFGVQIIGHNESGWFEVTAYVPKLQDRTKRAFLDWLRKAGWRPWSS